MELNLTILVQKDLSYNKKIKKLNKFFKRMNKKDYSECKCDNKNIYTEGNHIMHIYNSGIIDGYIFNAPIYKIYTYCNK